MHSKESSSDSYLAIKAELCKLILIHYKCINYRIFKTNFVLGKYLIELSVKSYTLAKFRTTNNRLPIEKGRWDNIERSQRFCPLCNCNLIGDEFHLLFQSEFSKILGKNYFQDIMLEIVILINFKSSKSKTS